MAAVKTDLEIGDIVQLNSGGPLMTVAFLKEKAIVCKWFVSAEALAVCTEEFVPDAIRLVGRRISSASPQ